MKKSELIEKLQGFEDLPIKFFVSEEIVSDDMYNYWLAETIVSVTVTQIYNYDEHDEILYMDENIDDFIDRLLDESDLTEAQLEKRLAEIPKEKVILIKIDV